MSANNRKWQSVNIMKLYTQTKQVEWNAWLTARQANGDVLGLEKMYYGLQIGMDDLVKLKMNTQKVIVIYLRWLKSIEITVKNIYKDKYPSPLDDPIKAKALKIAFPAQYQKFLVLKRHRDLEYENFLFRVRF